MKQLTIASLLVALIGLISTSAHAVVPTADIKGAKDVPQIKRYEGSVIIAYRQKAYDQYTLPLGKTSGPHKYDNSELLEGRVTRVSYLAPEGRSSLEVFRNYMNDLKAAGYEIRLEGDKETMGEYFPGNTYNDDYLGQIFIYSPENQHYLAARLSKPDGLTSVGLFVTEFRDGYNYDLTIPKGRAIIQLDVVESKPMETKMVLVKSTEMARSIGESGKIALYGIYFDFNKAEVKSESDATLAEIAKLLSDNQSLKLLLVGHTDNVGGLESNMDLSRRRAGAVVAALTGKYGVASGRLTPAGVGYLAPVATNKTEAGRAKNRRVELVEQ